MPHVGHWTISGLGSKSTLNKELHDGQAISSNGVWATGANTVSAAIG
jgi:hypothetical protein